MDIIRVTETYSNLGRLHRDPFQQPELPESLLPGEPQDDQSESLHQAPLSERFGAVKKALAEGSSLSAGQAGLLSEALSAQIITAAAASWGLNLHDLSQARLIPPRYV